IIVVSLTCQSAILIPHTYCYPHFVSPLLIVFPYPLILLPGARVTHILAGKQVDASTSNSVGLSASFGGTVPLLTYGISPHTSTSFFYSLALINLTHLTLTNIDFEQSTILSL
ncbi:hypothetical protein EDB83DRAFT_2494015, partial [Lactarius deliciosus]